MDDNSILNLVYLRNALVNLANCKNSLSNENIIDTELNEQIDTLTKTIEIKLKANCKHDYVEDYIDTDVEKSQRICYCSKCWSSFPVN